MLVVIFETVAKCTSELFAVLDANVLFGTNIWDCREMYDRVVRLTFDASIYLALIFQAVTKCGSKLFEDLLALLNF